MKRRLIQAVFLQSCGPLLLLLLSITISRFWGATEQGAFVSVKSWVDVIIAIGCFGFPQSVIIAINRLGTSRRSLYLLVPIYAGVLTPIFFVLCYFFGVTKDFLFSEILALVAGVACIVAVNIWRGILLTVDDGMRFHLITALPSVALVLFVFICLSLGFPLKESLPYLYAACGFVTLGLGYSIFPWRMIRELGGKDADLKQLITNGGDVFVQAVASSLQIYFCFWWLKHADGLAAAGYFSMALVALNAFGFPLQSVAPMILNRWSRAGDEQALHSGLQVIRKSFFLLALASALLIFVVPSVVAVVLGSDFKSAIPSIQVMLLAILPLLVFRVASLRLVAVGQFRFNSFVVTGRCFLLILLLHFLGPQVNFLQSATIVALVWVTVEALAAIVISWRVARVRDLLAASSEI